MISEDSRSSLIRAGDVDGLGKIYSESGSLVLHSEERLLAHRDGCDVAAYGSWRILFPKRIFYPISGRPAGRMFITSDRLVFFREISIWKEVKPLLTPLGLPTAAEKEAKLKDLKAQGARQYCEISYSGLSIASTNRKPALLHLRLVGPGRQRYELFVRTDDDDPGFFNLLEGKIGRKQIGARS